VRYKAQDQAPTIRDFMAEVRRKIEGRDLLLMVEPDARLWAKPGAADAGSIPKEHEFAEFIIVDAAMNDLLRPSFYQSHHEILPVREASRGTVRADVVGPVCESGDFLALDREMPNALPGDLLAVWTAGAYGFAMASNYNSRTRPAEVIVEGAAWRVARARETYEDLVRGEG